MLDGITTLTYGDQSNVLCYIHNHPTAGFWTLNLAQGHWQRFFSEKIHAAIILDPKILPGFTHHLKQIHIPKSKLNSFRMKWIKIVSCPRSCNITGYPCYHLSSIICCVNQLTGNKSMCEIEDGHIGRQRTKPESCYHQRCTHLDHTAETKLLNERADEGTCNSHICI